MASTDRTGLPVLIAENDGASGQTLADPPRSFCLPPTASGVQTDVYERVRGERERERERGGPTWTASNVRNRPLTEQARCGSTAAVWDRVESLHRTPA